MSSKVEPMKPPATKPSAMTFSINEIAKNVDVDGDGDIEPEEREILDTLKSMDVDGDGTISLKELVNLGGKMNEAKKNATFYKRLVWGVMLLCLLAMMGVFLACIAAVETTKDSRPEADGTLKTTVVGGAQKVVSTGVHKESIALTDLHKASFATLRGITDLGFKVGNRFYQYTITGFEQDFAASGDAEVRLFTSRGDTIFISKSAANLEKASGAKIDIAKASLALRRLLQEMANLADEDQKAAAGNVQTQTSATDTYSGEDITAMAGDFETDNTTIANPDRAFEMPCPTDMYQHGSAKKPLCTCTEGFTGATATFDPYFDEWVMEGECDISEPPAALNIQLTYTEVWSYAYASCGEGYKGKPEWNFHKQTWTGKCTKAKVPKGLTAKDVNFKEKDDYGMTVVTVEVELSCPKGFRSDPGNPIYWDYGYMKWTGKCLAEKCPEFSELKLLPSKLPDNCVCKKGYYGTGHEWDPASETWVFEEEDFCREKVMGRKYDCAELEMNSMEFLDCKSTAADFPPNAAVTNGWTADQSQYYPVELKCKDGFFASPKLTWDFSTEEWKGKCVEKPCFKYANKTFIEDWPACQCKPGYMQEGDGLWSHELEKYEGKCTVAKCPEGSAKVLGKPDGDYYFKAADGECACKPGMTGTGYAWSTEFNMYWDKDLAPTQPESTFMGCKKMTCPVHLEDHSDENGPQCGCPDGYDEVEEGPAGEEAFGITMQNDLWTFVGTCSKIPCPANTVAVDGEGADKSSYCKCDTSKGYKGKVNWFYPAQQEFMMGLLTEQAARAKVEAEDQVPTWFADCSPIPCPEGTKSINGTCYCNAGYKGSVILDAETKQYVPTCTPIYDFDAINLLPDYDNPEEADCDKFSAPNVPTPFVWSYPMATYVMKDSATGLPTTTRAKCRNVKCPTGTYDTDLTFSEMGEQGCQCVENGIPLTAPSGFMAGMFMPVMGGWDATTYSWKLTKASCSIMT